jgi:hypothetical protein
VNSIESHIRVQNMLGGIIELHTVINRGGVVGEHDPIIWLTTIVPVGKRQTCEIDGMALPAPHEGVFPKFGSEGITYHAYAISKPLMVALEVWDRKRVHGGSSPLLYAAVLNIALPDLSSAATPRGISYPHC